MNPLLQIKDLPDFQAIQPIHLTPAVDQLLAENKNKMAVYLQQTDYTWENFVEPMMLLEVTLDTVWDLASHLHAVKMGEWRDAYQENLPKIIDYHTAVSQNEAVYKAYESVFLSRAFKYFNASQKKMIEDALRDFRLSGVHLPEAEKKQYAALQQSLGKLTTQFEENLVDVTQAWHYYTEEVALLSGLPDHVLALAKENAKTRGKSGWWFTLEYACYFPVMAYAHHRPLREIFYEAYTTRASDQGPFKNQWDNGPLINEILLKRQCLAEVLGFQHYAALSLQTKVLKETEAVFTFLNDLVAVAHPKAKAEWQILSRYAKDKAELEALQAWDVAYYREKMQLEKYHVNQEETRPYFPLKKVVSGLFFIVKKLFNIDIREVHTSVWHDSVKFYAVYGENDKHLGGFYFDLFSRAEKREGAWMAEAKNRIVTPHIMQLPVAYLNCNFDLPTQTGAYLTHEQVLTLFHEFGHGLQHLLTTIHYPSVSGIHGVPWDVVEVASQLLENWCWEKEAIVFISENLPDALWDRISAARHFCCAMDLMRQLEFALFDFKLHAEYDKQNPPDVNACLNALRKQLSVLPTPSYNRFSSGFSHIFAGEYAAGYYSYLWAEVLSSDIFHRFQTEGIFNQAVAKRYLQLILSQGGVCEFLMAFFSFKGRNPTVDAFLQQRGLLNPD